MARSRHLDLARSETRTVVSRGHRHLAERADLEEALRIAIAEGDWARASELRQNIAELPQRRGRSRQESR